MIDPASATLAFAVAVALGSAVGGMARYAMVLAVESRRRDSKWPIGTLLVNLSGSLLLGVAVASPALAEPTTRAGVVAALGSFTTVSAFVLESWQRRAHRGTVLAYAVVTVVGCVALFRFGAAL